MCKSETKKLMNNYSKLEKEYPAYYKKITADDYDLEPIIWRYTDHNLQNGLSGKENYDEFIEYLKEEDETFAKAYDYPLPFAKGGMYRGKPHAYAAGGRVTDTSASRKQARRKR